MISKNIDEAVKILENNQLVAIPTETVYGLAGNAFSDKAITSIFNLKKRPLFNPLIVHIQSINKLSEVAQNIPKDAILLAEKFWPGPLTLVLPKKDYISNLVTAGKDTVAVRVPNHSLTLQLLGKLSFPLVAPSANPFTSISPTTPQHVNRYFKDQLPLILDGGACQHGIESTIVGFENECPVLYRLGALSVEEIETCIGKPLQFSKTKDKRPQAPGMLFKHYAPSTPTFLVNSLQDESQFIASKENLKIGLLRFKELSPNVNQAYQEILTTTGDLNEAAKNLYAALHRLDHLGLDIILAEKLPSEGLGITLNDKLKRASNK